MTIALVLVLAGGGAGGVRAQSSESAPPPGNPPVASVSLPAGHWAWDALRRLSGLGLAPEWPDRAQGFVLRSQVARVLARAAALAREQRPELAPLALGYQRRFQAEFGLPAPDSETAAHARWADLLPRRIAAGFAQRSGLLRAGVGYDSDWVAGKPVADTSTAFLDARWESVPDRHLALMIEPTLRSGTVLLAGGEVVGLLGPLGLWAGRHSASFGPAQGGGIVLGGQDTFDGVGAFLPEAFRFPWIFRGMGPIRMELFFSRAHGGDWYPDPWFGAFRGTMTPHPRLTLGLNRGTMFGGRGNVPVTFRSLFRTAIGLRADPVGTFDNEVVSVDVQYRPPLGPLPLVGYAELGMDDGFGAWHHEPAYSAGAELAALPGVPQLALGVERTSFAPQCCSNTIWYRNFQLRNGWADNGIVVGHPLGGTGWQWLGYAGLDLLDARLQLGGSGFLRDRSPENLLAPAHAGRSWGGSARASLRVGGALQLDASGALERGRSGWSESSLNVGIGWNY